MNWINVKDEMPEENQEIITVNYAGNDEGYNLSGVNIAVFLSGFFESSETAVRMRPTHWMPLPKSPPELPKL